MASFLKRGYRPARGLALILVAVGMLFVTMIPFAKAHSVWSVHTADSINVTDGFVESGDVQYTHYEDDSPLTLRALSGAKRIGCIFYFSTGIDPTNINQIGVATRCMINDYGDDWEWSMWDYTVGEWGVIGLVDYNTSYTYQNITGVVDSSRYIDHLGNMKLFVYKEGMSGSSRLYIDHLLVNTSDVFYEPNHTYDHIEVNPEPSPSYAPGHNVVIKYVVRQNDTKTPVENALVNITVLGNGTTQIASFEDWTDDSGSVNFPYVIPSGYSWLNFTARSWCGWHYANAYTTGSDSIAYNVSVLVVGDFLKPVIDKVYHPDEILTLKIMSIVDGQVNPTFRTNIRIYDANGTNWKNLTDWVIDSVGFVSFQVPSVADAADWGVALSGVWTVHEVSESDFVNGIARRIGYGSCSFNVTQLVDNVSTTVVINNYVNVTGPVVNVTAISYLNASFEVNYTINNTNYVFVNLTYNTTTYVNNSFVQPINFNYTANISVSVNETNNFTVTVPINITTPLNITVNVTAGVNMTVPVNVTVLQNVTIPVNISQVINGTFIYNGSILVNVTVPVNNTNVMNFTVTVPVNVTVNETIFVNVTSVTYTNVTVNVTVNETVYVNATVANVNVNVSLYENITIYNNFTIPITVNCTAQ